MIIAIIRRKYGDDITNGVFGISKINESVDRTFPTVLFKGKLYYQAADDDKRIILYNTDSYEKIEVSMQAVEIESQHNEDEKNK